MKCTAKQKALPRFDSSAIVAALRGNAYGQEQATRRTWAKSQRCARSIIALGLQAWIDAYAAMFQN